MRQSTNVFEFHQRQAYIIADNLEIFRVLDYLTVIFEIGVQCGSKLLLKSVASRRQ